MPAMSVSEALFMLLETPSRPLHLGALALFEPPPDATDAHARRMVEALLTHGEVAEVLRRRPRRPAHGLGYPSWSRVRKVDLAYHVRHAAVPGSGSRTDLLSLVSQIHSIPLDPTRPMWEVHVIEGLDDGRTALFTKIHLSLADGPAGLRLLHRAMATDPETRNCPAPWSPAVAAPPAHRRTPTALLRAGLRAGTDLLTMVPALAEFVADGLRERQLTLPLQSPPTLFNLDSGRARTVAARSWPTERLHRLAAAAHTPLDAVVLTMCAGALREYLLDRYALPEAPVTALLPVPLDLGRAAVGPRGHEPGTGATVIELATDEADPAARLARITAALTGTDRVVAALNHTQFLLLSAVSLSPWLLEPARRFTDRVPPPSNVLISYLPGPPRPRYYNGARLTNLYPVPVLLPGQGLSITVTTGNGHLDLGIVADRHAVPHVEQLPDLLEESLAALEHTLGTAPGTDPT